MSMDSARRAHRARLGIVILVVAWGICTPVGEGLLLHSLAAAVLVVCIVSLSLAAVPVVSRDGRLLARQRPLESWERRTIVGLTLLALGDGLVFLIVGAINHRGSWAVASVGIAASVGCGMLGVYSVMRS